MKKSLFKFTFFQITFVLLLTFSINSCETKILNNSEEVISNNIELDKEIKTYWYSGLAEISSYELTQQRYGEERKGKAVLIYVTEDFDHKQLVKTDQKKEGDFPVLKLNSTKNFTTGIYPYHIMQSSFLPMEENSQVAKITSSIQEWCGQSFMMLENRAQFEIQINSYFQKIGNQTKKLKAVDTENGLWNKLRLFPNKIDTTQTEMLPSFEYLRLNNSEVKAYTVKIEQVKNDSILRTNLTYPELKRNLEIVQELKKPYSILSWKESITIKDSTYVTEAKKSKQLNIDYWNMNKAKHNFLRDSLNL